MQDRLTLLFRLVRTRDWMHSKVPYVGACWAVYCDLANLQGYASDFLLIGGLVFLIAFLSFGYVINDWSDVLSDARVKKQNYIEKVGTPFSLVIVIILFIIGVVSIAFLMSPWHGISYAILGFIMSYAYSVRPIRFKERGILGVLLAAILQWPYPFIGFIYFDIEINWWSVGAGISLFLVGIRWILVHQLRDMERDQSSGIHTFAMSVGKDRMKRVVLRWSLPAEWACLLVTMLWLGWTLSYGWVYVALLVACLPAAWKTRRNLLSDIIWKRPLAVFYFLIFPVAAFASLAIKGHPVAAILVVWLLIIQRRVVVDLIRGLMP